MTATAGLSRAGRRDPGVGRAAPTVADPPLLSSSEERGARPLLERFSTPTAWLVVTALSIGLGLAMSRSQGIATMWQLGSIVGVIAVATLARRPDAVLAVIVYVGLSDVLWRSSSARGPYEGAKYAVIIGSAILVLRFVRRPRNRGLCFTLLALLVPGAVLGAFALGPIAAREYLTANLGGLVALALAVLAFSNLRLSPAEARGLYLVGLSPIMAMCVQATTSAMASNLTFTDEVNFAAAGGFGPNQVSSILCLGGLLCILVMLQRDTGWLLRALALATGVWLVGQAVLTFSRGGLFTLAIAAACITLVALTIAGQRARILVAVGVVLVVSIQVLAWVGAFTGGASEERLSSTNTTNRTEIAGADLKLFGSHPILGVGVGESKYLRDFPIQSAPHTEYSRLLAEHGVFGLAAIAVLLAICWRLMRDASGWYRMAAAGLLVTGLAQMAHSATRIASLGVVFGLAALRDEGP